MSGFPILDLVIGIIFVYFMLSIISSSAIELIITGLKARPKLLAEWLLKIFDKPLTDEKGNPTKKLGQAIMDHCTVTVLSKKGKSGSYMTGTDFVNALLEQVSFDPKNPTKVAQDIDQYIEVIANSKALPVEFQRTLLSYANEVKAAYTDVKEQTVSKLQMFSDKIESWYNSSMERLTGELKRRYSRPATFIIATVVTISLNADSIALAKYLYSNPEVRTKIAMAAIDATSDSALIKKVEGLKIVPSQIDTAATPDQIKQAITEKLAEIEKAKKGLADVMPLTWKAGELKKDGHYSARLIFAKITGLLATILAIMMGAPFWFDMLNKVSNLRGTGAKPAASPGTDTKKSG